MKRILFLSILFAATAIACGGSQTPVNDDMGEGSGDFNVDDDAEVHADAEPADYTVDFRGRSIDLEPYVQGFPYGSFRPDVEHGQILYIHETPEGDMLLHQELPADGELDLTAGRLVNDIDWSTRSFWGASWVESMGHYLIFSDEANEERMNLYTMDLETGAAEMFTDNDYTYGYNVSDDESLLAYIARNGTEEPFNSCLHIRNLADGTDREVVCDGGAEDTRFTWSGIYFSPDMSRVYVRVQQNMDRNQENLAVIDLTDDEPTIETLLEDGVTRYYIWMVDDTVTDEAFYYGSAESGFDNLYRFDLEAGEPEQITDYTDEMGALSLVAPESNVLLRVPLPPVRDRPHAHRRNDRRRALLVHVTVQHPSLVGTLRGHGLLAQLRGHPVPDGAGARRARRRRLDADALAAFGNPRGARRFDHSVRGRAHRVPDLRRGPGNRRAAHAPRLPADADEPATRRRAPRAHHVLLRRREQLLDQCADHV